MRTLRMANSEVWYVEWRDHRYQRRRWAAFTDRRASEELGRKLETLAVRHSVGLPLEADSLAWVDRLTRRQRAELAGQGLLPESYAQPAGRLDKHIDAYRDWLLAHDATPRHVSQAARNIRLVRDGIKASRLQDFDAAAVARFLKSCRDAGRSVRTSNTYLSAVKAWFAWMVKTGRAHINPVAGLQRLNEDVDRKHAHEPLTPAQLAKLLKAVAGNPARYWLYRLASETGLRASELRSLTVGSFRLVGKQPTVTVDAAHSRKAKRTVSLPLALATARGLRSHLKGRKRTDAALEVPQRTAATLKADLGRAGIKYEAGPNRYRDFHGLRHTFITNAGRYVETFADLQALARHSSPVLTARYAHARDLRGVVERLHQPD